MPEALEKDREKRFQSAAELEQALSKLDPRARFVPQATAIDGLLPGCCPKCNHQHDLSDKASAKRKFCESCGTALLEPCLKCGAENGVWAKFCGPCGADLNATLNAEIARLQTERDRAEVCHKSIRFAIFREPFDQFPADHHLARLRRQPDQFHPGLGPLDNPRP